MALAAHKETNLPRYLHAMETHLTNGNPFSISPTAVEGPFILGTTITYADLVLYQILHDEDLTQGGKKRLEKYQALEMLVEAVEAREGVRRYLESKRYRG